MAELKSNVWHDGTWYGPSYPNAGDPPEGSVDQRAYEDDDTPSVDDLQSVSEPSAPIMQTPDEYVIDPPEQADRDASGRGGGDEPPPRSGPGSSRARWLTYADEHGVRMRDDAPKDDIIAACEGAGVRTE